jgi:hypothetical protein
MDVYLNNTFDNTSDGVGRLLNSSEDEEIIVLGGVLGCVGTELRKSPGEY